MGCAATDAPSVGLPLVVPASAPSSIPILSTVTGAAKHAREDLCVAEAIVYVPLGHARLGKAAT